MCGSMTDIQSPTAEIRQGKKEEQTTAWKYIWPALLHRAAINNSRSEMLIFSSSRNHTYIHTLSTAYRHCRR